MRNILHIIIGLIVWNYIASQTNLAWGSFDLAKAFFVSLLSGIFGGVCGLVHEWLQEMVSQGSFSEGDAKLTAIGFIIGGLLAYAFNVPIWLFSVAVSVYVLDWVRIIFKWEL